MLGIRNRKISKSRRVEDTGRDVLVGAAGGLIGTAALWAIDGAISKWLPQAQAPMRVDPGPYMVHQGHRLLPARTWGVIPDKAEKAGAAGLSFGYGATFGALYGALRPQGGCSVVDGIVLGIVCWAAGYLGWLPAAGIMPPVWKQKPAQVAGPIVEHALYGMAAVGAYDLIKEHV